MSPHGHTSEEITTTTLSERTRRKRLIRVRRKAAEPQDRENTFSSFRWDNYVVPIDVDVNTQNWEHACGFDGLESKSCKEQRFELERIAIPH
jgi:hypothetical protein